MANSTVLVSSPPRDTPFFTPSGRIAEPWLGWFGSITSTATIVQNLQSLQIISEDNSTDANTAAILAELFDAMALLANPPRPPDAVELPVESQARDWSAEISELRALIAAGDAINFGPSSFDAAGTATALLSSNNSWTGTNSFNPPIAIGSGGTGQATQQLAINALTGTQSAGKYLRSDGTNATLASIVAADVPTLNQNTTGTAANVTGTVAIGNGGTGQTSQQLAINALTGTQSSGKYLRSDGTNATLANIVAADVPTLNQNTTGTAANVTGTVAIANGGTGQTSASAALTALGGASLTGTNSFTGANTFTSGNAARSTIATFTETGQASLVIQGQWGSSDLGANNGTLIYNTAGVIGLRANASTGNAQVLVGTSGALLIGSVTDNGTDKLQVTGSLNVSSGAVIGGKVTSYNGLSTVGAGVPSLIKTIDLTAQGAEIASTLLYAVPANGAGLYRVSMYNIVTRAATTSSTLPAAVGNWTDFDSGVGSGVWVSGQSTGNFIGANGAGNSYMFYARASTNITYNTSGYASVGATSMQFSLHIRLEFLG